MPPNNQEGIAALVLSLDTPDFFEQVTAGKKGGYLSQSRWPAHS